jgi:hypothetical protein
MQRNYELLTDFQDTTTSSFGCSHYNLILINFIGGKQNLYEKMHWLPVLETAVLVCLQVWKEELLCICNFV